MKSTSLEKNIFYEWGGKVGLAYWLIENANRDMVTNISRLNLILSAALMTSLYCKLYNANILQIRKIKILFTYLIASEDRKCASGRDFSIRLSNCRTRHAIARTRRVRQGMLHDTRMQRHRIKSLCNRNVFKWSKDINDTPTKFNKKNQRKFIQRSSRFKTISSLNRTRLQLASLTE